uniref:Uncharacterized protein n=1 Tax=Arundo donax TaxID=35708 RepID=A0A0A9A8M4_ARUDO
MVDFKGMTVKCIHLPLIQYLSISRQTHRLVENL